MVMIICMTKKEKGRREKAKENELNGPERMYQNIYLKLKNGIKGVTIFSVMTRLKIL